MAKKRRSTRKRTTVKRTGKAAIPKKWTTAKVRKNSKGQVQVLLPR